MAVALKQQDKERNVQPRMSKRRRSRSRRMLACLGAAVLLSGLMCYVGLYAMITQKGYERARLSAELKKAKTENEYLQAELRVLSSPDRLAAAAVSAGMIPSENVQIVRIPTSVAVAKAETGD